MALTPHKHDRNRRAELKRKREQPHTFNAGEPWFRRYPPKQYSPEIGIIKRQAIIERSKETGERFDVVAARNHGKAPGEAVE